MPKEFTGIFVPKEIIEEGLSPGEMMILSMIVNLQPFTASNRYISSVTNLSIRSVVDKINNLKKQGYIETKGKTSARFITPLKVTKAIIAQAENNSLGKSCVSTKANPAHTYAKNVKTKANPAYNSKYIKDIKVDNKEIVKSKPKTDELFKPIKESFLSKNDNQFTDWKKETMGIKGLIKKARARDKERPDIFIQGVIEKFYKMSTNGNEFWKSQPFLPSRLNSAGIFDSVLKQFQDSRPKGSDDIKYEIVEGLFGN